MANGDGSVGPTVVDDELAGEQPGYELRYDAGELRRLIAFSFSIGELSKFAERWRVFIDREGRPDDGARTLVRALETRGKLPDLVTSLKAHKPLVEWPEAQQVRVATPVEPAAPAATVAAASEVEAPAGVDAAPDSRAPLVDPFIAQQQEAMESEEKRPRWPVLAVVAATLAAGVAIGVAVVLVVTRDEPAAKPVAGSLARIAAAQLEESVDQVVSACAAGEDGDSARAKLRGAFRVCSAPQIRPSGRIDVALPAKPAQPPAPPDYRARAVNPRPATAAGSGCLDNCHDIHQQCASSQCGAEPSSAAEYAAYQGCLHSCMANYNRCRLGCR